MIFLFTAPTPSGLMTFQVEPGTSLFFVGANGGGKTRLAVRIEDEVGEKSHRISAHRALNLNPSVPKISEREALQSLRLGYGGQNGGLHHRIGSRWNGKASVSMLNDYDFLIQALFAEQANTSLETHKNARAGNSNPAAQTKFERLVEIWDRVLPHRKLDISGDDIQVSVDGSDSKYGASEMSDGERAVFYLIGQTLNAASDCLLIFDEPELHIHRSIMASLWDELEAARPDCATVLISHDLEFVASRTGQKFVLQEYTPQKGWTVEAVPDDTGFSEEITTLILGSRRPVLFVEGDGGSLDQAIYRACYPGWTIIPRGSCEEVIHAVITMRANASLTRIMCAGMVDADAYDATEIQFLQKKGIAVLPVSEIENLLLLPDVVKSILETEGFQGAELNTKVDSIMAELFSFASDAGNQIAVVMQYCLRRIDRTLKKLDLSASTDVASLTAQYQAKTASLDVTAVARMATENIQSAISNKNAEALLKFYDNKGLLSVASRTKGTKVSQFEQWIVRALRNGSAPSVSDAIRKTLPSIVAS